MTGPNGEVPITEDTEIEIIARDNGWSQVPGYPDRPAMWIFNLDGEAHYVKESEVEFL